MNVLSHQSNAYQELLVRANGYFSGHWKNLPIRTRWHSLVVGPTGSGKTALASMVCDAVNAKLLRISVPSWMPAGAHNRSVAETIGVLAEHIQDNRRTILFLDELDKLNFETSWHSHLKGEIYELLDGNWPAGTKSGSLSIDDEGTLSLSQLDTLTEKLRSSVFVIAAGTFQEFYEREASSEQIGFHAKQVAPLPFGPTHEALSKNLPRELLNRFNSQIVLLPQLQSSHYLAIARQAEDSLPAWLRPAFRDAATRRLKLAVTARSGCRFIEEALCEALTIAKAPRPDPVSEEPEPVF